VGDPHAPAPSALADASLAVELLGSGDTEGAGAAARRARAGMRGLTRRDRQHVQVMAAAALGQRAHAEALAREHLLEFPDDEAVRRLAGPGYLAPGGASPPCPHTA
jgi:stage V sporulation protein SpoVS